ncbi:MAG: 16S rRNA (guanine(966)-N(2))-methyltransferase RsmD [Eubacteriales bacterium]|jgi:16S rRNA (guanine(966)-N(2))-methyltransferase RsmD
MRIITGKYRSRLLLSPKCIRPTQNKVRKAVFDILGDVNGLSFLELFAGSGAVGFEALSRGASGVVLVEENREAQTAINGNIQALKVENCLLIPGKAESALPFLQKSGRKFDVLFMDPPYNKDLAKKILQILGACDILAPNAFVIVQHFKNDALDEEAVGLHLIKKAKYGDTLLSFYQKE